MVKKKKKDFVEETKEFIEKGDGEKTEASFEASNDSTSMSSSSESNRKMRPTEWAKEDGLDHHLFLHWDNELMSREEYEKLKEKAL